MQHVICPKCGLVNTVKHKFCRKCEFPIKKQRLTGTFLIVPILILAFLFLFSIGVFVYLEIRHPDYGIRKRVAIAWDVLTSPSWIENYMKPLKQSDKK